MKNDNDIQTPNVKSEHGLPLLQTNVRYNGSDTIKISDLRNAIESLFDGETAENTANYIQDVIAIERYLKKLADDKMRKRVLLALCRQFGVTDTELGLLIITP